MSSIQFTPVSEAHLSSLADILNHYILTTTITFHEETLKAEDMAEKVFFSKEKYQSFVIQPAGSEEVIGYCAVSPWKKQEAYKHTAEINIYLAHTQTGRGIGREAIRFLEDHASRHDIHHLIAGICAENEPSIKLFSGLGYIECARFRNVGLKFGRPLDVVYHQKTL